MTPAEELALMADEIEAAATDAGYAVIVADAWAADIRRLVEFVEAHEAAPAPLSAPCARRAPGTARTECDRPQGHAGAHSWEADIVRRRAREAEETAARVPELYRKLGNADRQMRRMRSELTSMRLEAEAMHRPRRKPDRG